MDTFSFILSVIAGVVANYICKWLDGELYRLEHIAKNRPPSCRSGVNFVCAICVEPSAFYIYIITRKIVFVKHYQRLFR